MTLATSLSETATIVRRVLEACARDLASRPRLKAGIVGHQSRAMTVEPSRRRAHLRAQRFRNLDRGNTRSAAGELCLRFPRNPRLTLSSISQGPSAGASLQGET